MSNKLPKYERWSQLKKRIPFCKTTLYALINQGKFPPPVKLTERISAWDVDSVNEWLESRKEAA